MRRLWLLFLVAGFLNIAQGQEDRARKVRELVELTGALDRIRPSFDDAFDLAATLVRPAHVERVRGDFGRAQLAAVVVPIYGKHFDDETLDAALAFLKSPAGKRYLAAEERAYLDATLAAGPWVDEALRARVAGPEAEREAERGVALTKCKEYYDCTRTWHMIQKKWPQSLETMEAPVDPANQENFVEVVPDPWGKKYVLRFDGKKPRVVSLGPDGVENTADDIAYPEER